MVLAPCASQSPRSARTWSLPDNRKFSIEDQLRHLLYKPKEIHLKGSAAYKTGTLLEARALVKACFDVDGTNWETGQYQALPKPKEAEGGIGTLCIAVAALQQDLGTVTRQPGNKMRARKAMVQKANSRSDQTVGFKVTKPDPAVEVKDWRKAGSTVYMGVEMSSNGMVFRYYDAKHPLQLAPRHHGVRKVCHRHR